MFYFNLRVFILPRLRQPDLLALVEPPPTAFPPWWDQMYDLGLLLAVDKHGLDHLDAAREDPELPFGNFLSVPVSPSILEL